MATTGLGVSAKIEKEARAGGGIHRDCGELRRARSGTDDIDHFQDGDRGWHAQKT